MRRTSQAFTRLELLAVLAALLLLAVLALPLLAAMRSDSERAACFNNLRQMGRASHQWADERTGRFPWITFVGDGGTKPDTVNKSAVVWTEFITLSNELVRPQILACPSERAAKVAGNWGGAANGLANTGLRNNAVSYFLNYHGPPELPRAVITGDRDFNPSSTSLVGCSRGNLNNAVAVGQFVGVPVRWTNAVHAAAGHLLFVDGSVEFVGSARLNNVLFGPEVQNDSSSVHLIYPR